jgi:hypothetical protein
MMLRRKRMDSISSSLHSQSSSDDSEEDSKLRSESNDCSLCLITKYYVFFAFLFFVGYMLVSLPFSLSSYLRMRNIEKGYLSKSKESDHLLMIMEEEDGLDQLPPLNLDHDIVVQDVFGVAQTYLRNYTSSFMKQSQNLQEEFASLYGGIRPSRYLLENTLFEFQGDSWVRLLQRKRRSTLHMVIVGQATAAGYGNFHHHAFSFSLQSIMEKTMSMFKIKFLVTNIALEHVAILPYLWCIPEFTRKTAEKKEAPIDIVYLDLDSLMELNDFEIVLRQIIGLSTPPPQIIIRDMKQHEDRFELLQDYIKKGALHDPVLLDWKDAVLPFLQLKPSRRPSGFSDWSTWGAEEASHKQAFWTVSQHKMVAWILSMFLLKQLELLVAAEEGFYSMQAQSDEFEFFPPFRKFSDLNEPCMHHLAYPSPSRKCLTTFDPADNLIPSSGESNKEVHLEHPKGMMFYTSGWVLDLENSERKEKLRSQHLGFKDILASYHGLSVSGTITFNFKVGEISGLILCESQYIEKRDQGCKLHEDVSFLVNDEPVDSIQIINHALTSFQGKNLCVYLDFKSHVTGDVTLAMSVSNNKIALSHGPCSISHILWQDALEIKDED